MLQTLHTLTKSLLPSWIYHRLIGNWNPEGFKKYFKNTGWIVFAKVITFAMSFLTIAIVARYLGPENYGKLSYAQSFVAIFSVFASLGINQIIYRELAAHPERESELLGTTLITQLVFGALTLLVSVASAIYLNDDLILTWLICIIALNFIFQPFGVVAHYFNAQVMSRYPSYITIGLAFLIPILKLFVVFLDQGILYFASIIVIEALLYSLFSLYIYIYIIKHSVFSWSFSYTTFTKLLKDSWPLLLTGLSGYVYGRIDQVMIQQLLDSTSVGLYDAAVRLTEVWGFFPGILIISLFPAIINAKNTNYLEYIKRLKILSFFTLIIAFCISSVVFLAASLVVAILFGPDFEASSSILRIYVWTLIGAIAVTLIQTYLISENRSKTILILTTVGAALNILLNWLWIPIYGVNGAAAASIISYASIIMLFIITERQIIKRKLSQIRE